MGEYISREAAIEETRNPRLTDAELRRRLALIPATVVVEVRHGRWKKSYADHEAFGVRPFFRYCSECHEATVHQYNYCPNCGAKMDGGSDE